MLNKPKFMRPSTNMQECVVDINSDELWFSCIADGNEAVYAWRIQIFRLNDNVLVYDTGKITKIENGSLSPIFYPINEKNQNEVFKINLKGHSTVIVPTEDNKGNTIKPEPKFINAKEEYYWTIEFWNNTDANNADSVATAKSCEEVFYANLVPTINLTYSYNKSSWMDLNDDVVLYENECYFKSTYTSEHSSLKRYGWRIIDEDNNQILIDTISHNQIYGTADNIICSYDGFLNSGNYSIELYTETQNGAIASKKANFSVMYESTFLSNDFKVEALKYEPAVMLDWKESVVIGGKMVGTDDSVVNLEEENPFKEQYPIVDYTAEQPSTSITIPKEKSIVYDSGSSSNLDIEDNCYIVLSTQLQTADDTVLFDANGEDDNGFDVMRKLSFIGGRFVYKIVSNGSSIERKYTPKYPPNKYVWYVITMAPLIEGSTQLIVNESVAENGIYPSESTYPSSNLFPSFGTWTLKVEGEGGV